MAKWLGNANKSLMIIKKRVMMASRVCRENGKWNQEIRLLPVSNLWRSFYR